MSPVYRKTFIFLVIHSSNALIGIVRRTNKLTVAETVRPPVPLDTPVVAFPKSKMKSEGNVWLRSAVSTIEFFSPSNRAGARGLNVDDDVLDEILTDAVLFEMEILLLQIVFERIPNVQRTVMIAIYDSFEFDCLLDVK